MKFLLFSRDLRTHCLFRKSWILAAEKIGSEIDYFNRGFGFSRIFIALFKFITNFNARRVVFGTAEICLYLVFSNKKDILVFTGLGRLFLNDFYLQFIRYYFRIFYRKQTIVALNEDDAEILSRIFLLKPVVIDGEGYLFNINNISSLKNAPDNAGIKFAYIGRMLKSKGVDTLINTFAEYSHQNWILYLIGDCDFDNGDSLSETDFISAQKKSIGEIIQLGFQNNISKAIADVDILISLSHREGLPFSVLDGISNGLSIVLSPVPGHLSFNNLPGVFILKDNNVQEFFINLNASRDLYMEFNREERLKIVDAKFGQHAIVNSIVDKVYSLK